MRTRQEDAKALAKPAQHFCPTNANNFGYQFCAGLATHVGYSVSWVEGSYGCDKTKNQIKTIKMLLNSPLSFLLFVYSLILLRLILYFTIFFAITQNVNKFIFISLNNSAERKLFYRG